MILPPALKSLMCRHDFYWSERQGVELCRHCSASRPDQGDRGSMKAPIAVLLAGGDEDDEVMDRPSPRPLPDDWGFPPIAAARAPVHSRPTFPAKPVRPVPVEADRGAVLLDRLDRLADGDDLSRAEVIEVMLALIEDAQSSDPVMVGTPAATYFARLHGALAQA